MGIFFGGMTAIGRSKSINAFIKWIVSFHTNLTQLIVEGKILMFLNRIWGSQVETR